MKENYKIYLYSKNSFFKELLEQTHKTYEIVQQEESLLDIEPAQIRNSIILIEVEEFTKQINDVITALNAFNSVIKLI